jgi:hypothetical protein
MKKICLECFKLYSADYLRKHLKDSHKNASIAQRTLTPHMGCANIFISEVIKYWMKVTVSEGNYDSQTHQVGPNDTGSNPSAYLTLSRGNFNDM